MQLGHLKLNGNGLLLTQGVQNRSQKYSSVSQSEVILQYVRDPGAPAELGPKGVNKAPEEYSPSNSGERCVPYSNHRGTIPAAAIGHADAAVAVCFLLFVELP